MSVNQEKIIMRFSNQSNIVERVTIIILKGNKSSDNIFYQIYLLTKKGSLKFVNSIESEIKKSRQDL